MAYPTISAADITRNVTIQPDFTVTGDGIFDDFMETTTKHIVAQLESNRIRQEDFATFYTTLFKDILEAAIQYNSSIYANYKSLKDAELNDKQADLIAAQILKTNAEILKINAETAAANKQIEVYTAQISKINAEINELVARKQYYEAGALNYQKQAEAYRDKVKLELMKYCIDTWSTAFAVASDNPDLSIVPNSARAATNNEILTNIRTLFGV